MDELRIDFKRGEVQVRDGPKAHCMTIGSPEAFAAISDAWLRSGRDAKYVYTFTWLGRPIIQLPEDMVRLQEVIFAVQPDVIVETGVAHGGGLIFDASLCKALGKGRVIGVDVEIRPHNREAIERHLLGSYVTLIEGSSVAAQVVAQVKHLISADERVLVTLDSAHNKAHVLAELESYAPLVSVGSYIVAMDGIMSQVAGAPRTGPDWGWNNPQEAACEFVAGNRAFEIVEPAFLFNESSIHASVTYWPGAFVRRVR